MLLKKIPDRTPYCSSRLEAAGSAEAGYFSKNSPKEVSITEADIGFRRFVRFGFNEELVGFKSEGVGEFLDRSRGGELLFCRFLEDPIYF